MIDTTVQARSLFAAPTPGYRMANGRINVNGVVRFDDGPGTGRSTGFDITIVRLGPSRIGAPTSLGLPPDAVGWAFRYYDGEPRISVLRRHTSGAWVDATPWRTMACRAGGNLRFDVTIQPLDADRASVTFEMRDAVTGGCSTTVSYVDASLREMMFQEITFGFNGGSEWTGWRSMTLPYYQVNRANVCNEP